MDFWLRRAAITLAGVGVLACSQPRTNATDQRGVAPSIGDAAINDIVPLPDGGAYAFAADKGIWYVRGSEAVRVKEVASFTLLPTNSSTPPSSRWLQASVVHQRRARRKAEKQLHESQMAAADEDPPEDYRP